MHERSLDHLAEATALAEAAGQRGNAPYGAVLVRGGQVIARGQNSAVTENDIAAHAELSALRDAARRYGPEVLRECVLYASGEPCAMCAGAIYRFGIPTVVFGCSARAVAEALGTGTSAVIGCREIFALGEREVEVIGPVAEAEGVALHRRFPASPPPASAPESHNS
jgi:tRNA(Arg) A34 adenosine deaminase TadA